MNEIVNKFSLATDKFMPGGHWWQLRFTYGLCGPFTKHKERIQNVNEVGDSQYIYQNELDIVFSMT